MKKNMKNELTSKREIYPIRHLIPLRKKEISIPSKTKDQMIMNLYHKRQSDLVS